MIDRRNFMLSSGAVALATLSAPRGAAAQGTPVLIAESQGHGWTSFFVADGAKLWEKHGLSPTLSKQTSGRMATDAVLGGKAQFGTTTDSVVILAGMRGLKPIVLADFTRTTEMYVTARTDRGIKTPKDLKGRRIATQIGTSGHYYLSRYLSVHDLTVRDIQLVNVPSSDVVNALIRGDVDAFAWSYRAGQVAEANAPQLVRMLSNDGVEAVWVSHLLLVASEDTVRNTPHVARAAVAALLDAEDLIVNRTQQAAEIVADRTKTSVEDTLSAFKLNDYAIKLDERLVLDMVSNAEWAIGMNLSVRPKQPLAELFRSLIDDRFLRELRPDRVTI